MYQSPKHLNRSTTGGRGIDAWQKLILDQKFEELAYARVAREAATVPVIVPQLRGTGYLLREVFGNPFHPITFDPAWRTFDVTMIAAGAYEDRAFDRLPILADALQDPGCENADILSHLRGGGPHVRGCWALDLILGKS